MMDKTDLLHPWVSLKHTSNAINASKTPALVDLCSVLIPLLSKAAWLRDAMLC
jgi:hypothetical protein